MVQKQKIVSEKTQIEYKRKQKNLFVAKAIEAKVWLLLQVKIEIIGLIFSQETRKRGYWRPRKQKVFICFLFYVLKMVDIFLFELTE
ncbi:hypothetical protein [uncultured Granulicatella sp.]|uniref:hypothetical protein n=1 Tax=uncultured Granulicatella sp. TaxID=316089 RepID=UPI0028DD339E|nr:hypothetical protein [uncultured Granulicatella sp.]